MAQPQGSGGGRSDGVHGQPSPPPPNSPIAAVARGGHPRVAGGRRCAARTANANATVPNPSGRLAANRRLSRPRDACCEPIHSAATAERGRRPSARFLAGMRARRDDGALFGHGSVGGGHAPRTTLADWNTVVCACHADARHGAVAQMRATRARARCGDARGALGRRRARHHCLAQLRGRAAVRALPRRHRRHSDRDASAAAMAAARGRPAAAGGPPALPHRHRRAAGSFSGGLTIWGRRGCPCVSADYGARALDVASVRALRARGGARWAARAPGGRAPRFVRLAARRAHSAGDGRARAGAHLCNPNADFARVARADSRRTRCDSASGEWLTRRPNPCAGAAHVAHTAGVRAAASIAASSPRWQRTAAEAARAAHVAQVDSSRAAAPRPRWQRLAAEEARAAHVARVDRGRAAASRANKPSAQQPTRACAVRVARTAGHRRVTSSARRRAWQPRQSCWPHAARDHVAPMAPPRRPRGRTCRARRARRACVGERPPTRRAGARSKEDL